MVAVHGTGKPTIVVLYQEESDDARQIKSYHIDMQGKTMLHKPNFHAHVETTAHMLISVPEPYGGVLVIGEFMISYYDLKVTHKSISIDSIMVTAYGLVKTDEPVFWLGDSFGTFYQLAFKTSAGTISGLTLEYLGKAPVPSSIVHLADDFVYIGSTQSDSCLLRLQRPGLSREQFQIIEEYPSLAPITDFCVFDLDKQGRKTMMCCSGVNSSGSLRVIQSGVGFIEQVNFEMPDVKRLCFDDTIVISTIDETRILHQPSGADGLEEMSSFSAFRFDCTTLIANTVIDDMLVQVTPFSVRLMSNGRDGKLLQEWEPPVENAFITVASLNACQCVLSYQSGFVVYLEIENRSLVEKSARQFESEVACIDISPMDDRSAIRTDKVALGLWKGTNVRILRLPDLDNVIEDQLPYDVVPRSVLLSTLEDQLYLFVTLGDGLMVYYKVYADCLSNRKETTLGTRVVTLHPFYSNGEKLIFAASDRPTIISSRRRKLTYLAVNHQYVDTFTTFDSKLYPASMIVVSGDTVSLGKIDSVRKLHITKLPLDQEMGRRILYHEESKTIAVGTIKVQRNPDSGEETSTGWLRIFDARTFQEDNEAIESMATARLKGHGSLFVFVGTAIIGSEEDSKRSRGRLLMFKVTDNHEYEFLDAVNLPGVVYSIKPYMKSIAASVNGSIYYLSSFNPDAPVGERLSMASLIHSNVVVLTMDTRGEFILVGDLMQSMALLKMDDSSEPKMKVVAADFEVNWMTAVKMIEDDIFVGAEMFCNLFTLKRVPAVAGEEMTKLQSEGEYHLGDSVNRFQSGSLADDISESNEERLVQNSFLYVTVNGAIGVVASLTEKQYEMLSKIQSNIKDVLPATGDLHHDDWRTFNNLMRTRKTRNFIDGDLVEKFLYLKAEDKQRVIRGDKRNNPLNYTMEEVQSIVEDFSSLR
ncbi:DNA damage-binding protein 1a [Apophysomyces ossiformis]|uniref:DNA damage-binding protein 1a n=1 Tax=Apophysomyces ossiformis TaxID=679940 RepID=A0A8H7BUM3_9FUNG|nr:DNA damage-binding protein 1a [Apophysomyces ossiformis]